MTRGRVHPAHGTVGRKRLGRAALLLGLIVGLISGMSGQAQSPNGLPPEARRLAARAVEQLSVAIREAVFAWPASDAPELRTRAARMLNVTVGASHRHYRPEVGDPPGADGGGVIPYLQRLRELIRQHATGDGRERRLLFALEIALSFARQAQGDLVAALRGPVSVDDLRLAGRRSFALLSAARGASEDPLSEGGVRALLAQLASSP